jgi:hypothetical protein
VFEKAKLMENEDRECFSRNREGWEVVGREDLSKHPHPSLVPLFQENGDAQMSAFKIEPATSEDCDRNYRAFVLNRSDREKLGGELSIVPSLSQFKTTFLDVFCEGELS